MVVSSSEEVVVSSSEVVAAVSDAVVESSVDAQELTPSARTVTRTRMNRKYLRKLKMDIILLHEGIKNPNCSVSIILPNKPLIIANSRTEFHICQHFYFIVSGILLGESL